MEPVIQELLESSDPFQLLNYTIDELKLGLTQSSHPFRTCTLATESNGYPHVRTVVLRDINRNASELFFHSDNRSKKNNHILNNDHTALLFYSQSHKIQVCFNGTAHILTNQDELRQRFNLSKPTSRVCYGFKSMPGTKIPVPKKELLEPTIYEPLTHEKNEFAFTNFSVVKFIAQHCDILYLHHTGHIKIESKYFANAWHPHFIVA